MQGAERSDRELLDASALVGHLVPAGSMFAFLAEHRGRVFPDEQFADLFPSAKGRRSMPAPVAASILTLQTLLDYSDAEAAEAARCDLRWKVACGLALDDTGFHPSTLTYWRRRLARSERPHRITDAVRQVVQATGVLRGRRRRAVDSTILADAVATQDTVTQLISQIRRVGRVVPGAVDQIAAVCPGHDYTRPGKPDIDWDDPAAKDALVSALVTDANSLVAALAGAKLDEPAAQALALLALVAGQDVEPAEGSDGTDGRWRIARQVAEDRVVSTVHPEARHTRKSPEARRDGYRAHLAADPDTGIITDEQLTKAAGRDNSDPAVAAQFLANDIANDIANANDRDGGPHTTAGLQHSGTDQGQAGDPDRTASWQWYGDSAYGTGELRDALGQAGHEAVIKPKPVQSPVAGGFTIDDFAVDDDEKTVTCPAGHTRPVSPIGRVATFGALCRICPLRERCTTSKTGRKVVLHEHDALLRQARREWKSDPTLRERYRRHRPNIERVIAQGCQPRRAPVEAALPRRGTQQRLAQTAYRRAQPPQPDQPGPALGQRMGPRNLLTAHNRGCKDNHRLIPWPGHTQTRPDPPGNVHLGSERSPIAGQPDRAPTGAYPEKEAPIFSAFLVDPAAASRSGRDDLAMGGRGRGAGCGHFSGDGGGLEALEGQPQTQRELPQSHREGGDRRPCGELRDDAEERRDGGGDEQGGSDESDQGDGARHEA